MTFGHTKAWRRLNGEPCKGEPYARFGEGPPETRPVRWCAVGLLYTIVADDRVLRHAVRADRAVEDEQVIAGRINQGPVVADEDERAIECAALFAGAGAK